MVTRIVGKDNQCLKRRYTSGIDCGPGRFTKNQEIAIRRAIFLGDSIFLEISTFQEDGIAWEITSGKGRKVMFKRFSVKANERWLSVRNDVCVTYLKSNLSK